MEPRQVPALFVHLPGHLTSSGGGGVQICTREYWAALAAAGFQLTAVEMGPDRRVSARLMRWLSPDPYGYLDERNSAARLRAMLAQCEYIFLNQRNLGPVAGWVRRESERHRIVMLSHGLESVEYLHSVRGTSRRTQAAASHLGRLLLAERTCNGLLDHVFCLSPTETEIERWLGARSVSWLPRTVSDRSLEWRPERGRLGFVGTVDHPPNRDGLLAFLEALDRSGHRDVHLRLVGGPDREAKAIARRFPVVQWLGQLDDAALEREASTWSCFVHPLFVYARGCSTKLATAVGWRLPIATTRAGARGYLWRDGDLEFADTPEELVTRALRLAEPNGANVARAAVERIARSVPRLPEIAMQIQRDLGLNAARGNDDARATADALMRA